MAAAIELGDLGDDRIRLRRVEVADAAEVARICQDPDIQIYTRVPSPYTQEHAREFAELSRTGLEQGTGAHLLVVGREDGQLLGAVGVDVDHAERTGVMGYWVAPEARGRGVATRATRLLCGFVFDRLGLARVEMEVAVTNAGSNEVARRVGFVLEGVRRQAVLDGPSGDPHAPRCDANVWGLLPGELTRTPSD